jgi:Leucine-rich repeat (LRR) protein
MTKPQEYLNNEFSKEVDKIKIDCEDFDDSLNSSLTVEGYSNLMEINISESEKIRQLTLKNLPNLTKCTVKGCEVEQLNIENCPNIEFLNVYNNSLTSLSFVKDLANLSTLEISKNEKISSGIEFLSDSLETFSYKRTELAKILESHNQD